MSHVIEQARRYGIQGKSRAVSVLVFFYETKILIVYVPLLLILLLFKFTLIYSNYFIAVDLSKRKKTRANSDSSKSHRQQQQQQHMQQVHPDLDTWLENCLRDSKNISQAPTTSTEFLDYATTIAHSIPPPTAANATFKTNQNMKSNSMHPPPLPPSNGLPDPFNFQKVLYYSSL